ncbi:MAG: multiheme c-type cytochrome, partial [Bryobacteraceae bacterium]
MKRVSVFLFCCAQLLQAAAHPCAVCHPREVQQYTGSPMAHSSATPENQTSGTFTHTLSGTTFSVISTPTGMTQAIARRGIVAKYPVAYVIGSGHHAFGYLIRIGDYLFQSPISYYSRRGAWDMAPGYEHDRLPDFTRPVTYDCLLCHAGSSFPVDETMNRYKPPYVGVTGISCSRCHGPVEAHLRKPSRNNIINPARLPSKERDSVCEQCHLAGEARVANPGRKFSDFQPGEKLEDVYSIYVFDNS